MHALLRVASWPALLFVGLLAIGLLNPQLLQEAEEEAIGPARRVLTYLIPIGLWLSGAWCLIRLLNVLFWDRLVAKALGRPVPRLLKDCLAVIIMAAAVTAVIGFVFEKSVAAVWATSSVLGVVVGLALRGIILDVFTGLAINIDRTFQIGDWLEIHYRDFRASIYGRVTQINWRNTLIELENKNVVIMPNSLMGSTPLTNYSLPDDLARFEISVVLDFAVPPERAMRILLAGAKAAIGTDGPVDSPEPRVLVNEATEMGIRYRVRYFQRVQTVSPTTCRHTVTRSVLEHLHKAGLTPAYPKRDHYYSRMPQRNSDLREGEGLVPLLAEVDFFAQSLHADELEELARAMHRHVFQAGDTIIQQGDEGESMFILAEGLAFVYVAGEPGGERVKVSQIVPGQAFGEMSLLTGEPRSATVIAATDVVSFEVAKEKMQRILERRPEVAEPISAIVAQRRSGLSKALTGAALHAHLEEKGNAYTQLLEKMKRFFGSVFGVTSNR